MRRLRALSVCDVEAGLSDAEVLRIERTFGFRFADDHRAFLAAGLPVNTRPEPRAPGVLRAHREPWPDWRHHDVETLRAGLARPVEGVVFDVETNGFWYDAWGARPDRSSQAVEVARRALAQVPVLVTVYGHRYLHAGAGTFGHPVLSLSQTDVICYGLDLADYVEREFGVPVDRSADSPRATVGFWRDLL